MSFNKGLDIAAITKPLGLRYGKDIIGPKVEIRKLNDIRKTLRDENSDGPEDVYAIAMDVYYEEDKAALLERDLLFGVVTYAKGTIGKEPVRSQGHIHAHSKSCNMSTPELYEIWEGEAYIYMQESGGENPGACYAIHAKAGDVVIVPPGWVHATISADRNEQLSFGAWCVRDYGFDYADVRAREGIAWFPIWENDRLIWEKNENYIIDRDIIIRPARAYPEFGMEEGLGIYAQFQKDPDRFLFVSKPQLKDWEGFNP